MCDIKNEKAMTHSYTYKKAYKCEKIPKIGLILMTKQLLTLRS